MLSMTQQLNLVNKTIWKLKRNKIALRNSKWRNVIQPVTGLKRLRSVQSVPWRLLNLTVKNNYDFELILDVLEVVKVRIFRSLTNLKKTYFSSNYDTDNKKCPWITQISIKNMLYVIKWHTVYRHLQITINSTVLYLPNLIHIFHHRNKKKTKKYVKINISIKHFKFCFVYFQVKNNL